MKDVVVNIENNDDTVDVQRIVFSKEDGIE